MYIYLKQNNDALSTWINANNLTKNVSLLITNCVQLVFIWFSHSKVKQIKLIYLYFKTENLLSNTLQYNFY